MKPSWRPGRTTSLVICVPRHRTLSVDFSAWSVVSSYGIVFPMRKSSLPRYGCVSSPNGLDMLQSDCYSSIVVIMYDCDDSTCTDCYDAIVIILSSHHLPALRTDMMHSSSSFLHRHHAFHMVHPVDGLAACSGDGREG